MRKTLVIGMTAVMVLMAFMASSPTAAAATWTVDDDGTADFSTIQAAINAASDGDTIIVHEGTYTEVITEFEGLTVKAVDGDTVTVQAGWNDIQVLDTTAPELIIETAPELIIEDDVITVEQETRDGTVVSLTATATDISDADVEITSDELAIYPLGTTTVTFTAIDASGNTVTCTRTVTVVDTTAPELIIETAPELIIEDDVITVEQETRDGTVVSLTATATDISDADVEITSDELAIYPLGTRTVTFTAIDASGNTVTCTRTVTVVDTTAPELIIETAPELIIEDDVITVEQETRDGTVVSLTATATDISDADVEITSDELAIYPLGTRTVTFTAIDASGNTVTCTRTVTVVDTTAPELIIETAPELIIEDDVITVEQETRDGTVVSLTATATDISDADVEITSDELAIYPLGTRTVTFTATDASGNSATCTTTVTVIDTTPPDISVTVSPDTLWPPNHKMVDIVATVTVSDIVDAAPTVVLTSVTSNEPDNAKGKGDGNTVNDIHGAETEIGTEEYNFQLRAERAGKGDGRVYTITYTVTDASGISASATATVVVPHSMGE